jgi:hypothetical protein
MPDDLPVQGQRFATGNQTRRWIGRIGVAAAVGLAYFLVAQVTVLGLVLEPDSISVFWPAAGVSSGALIALGPRWRWPGAAGIAAAEAVIAQTAAQEVWRNLWVTAAVVLCDTAEPIITAGLIARVFGAGFALDRVGSVLGLLAASVAGAAVSTFGATVALGWYFGPSISMLIIAQHWFVGLIVGVMAASSPPRRMARPGRGSSSFCRSGRRRRAQLRKRPLPEHDPRALRCARARAWGDAIEAKRMILEGIERAKK